MSTHPSDFFSYIFICTFFFFLIQNAHFLNDWWWKNAFFFISNYPSQWCGKEESLTISVTAWSVSVRHIRSGNGWIAVCWSQLLELLYRLLQPLPDATHHWHPLFHSKRSIFMLVMYEISMRILKIFLLHHKRRWAKIRHFHITLGKNVYNYSCISLLISVLDGIKYSIWPNALIFGSWIVKIIHTHTHTHTQK